MEQQTDIGLIAACQQGDHSMGDGSNRPAQADVHRASGGGFDQRSPSRQDMTYARVADDEGVRPCQQRAIKLRPVAAPVVHPARYFIFRVQGFAMSERSRTRSVGLLYRFAPTSYPTRRVRRATRSLLKNTSAHLQTTVSKTFL